MNQQPPHTSTPGNGHPLAPISAEQLKQVLDVSRMLAVTTELDPLLKRIAEACCGVLGCDRSSIFLHDPRTDQLWTKVALQSGEIRVPSASGIVGHAFKTNSVFHCPRPYEDPRFNPEPDRKTGFKTRNLLTAPMVDIDRQPVGVIQAINKGAGFTPADEALIQLLADQAGVAIQRFRLQQAAIEGVELRREMDLAKTVQEAMIPEQMPQVAGIASVGWTQPASITGGDCFDLWRLADGRLGIFLADASGHGIGPALVVAQARTLVRAMCDMEPDPTTLLSRVNARLAEDLEVGRFVTAFVGVLDSRGELRWCSAGHGPVLVRTRAGGEVAMLDPPAPPLGVMPEFLADPVEPLTLDRGGSLVVLSDGIFEAFNAAGEQFGVENVIKIAQSTSGTPEQLLARIRDSVQQWQGNDEPADDQTVVVASRVG